MSCVVLLADDNADIRDSLVELLEGRRIAPSLTPAMVRRRSLDLLRCDGRPRVIFHSAIFRSPSSPLRALAQLRPSTPRSRYRSR